MRKRTHLKPLHAGLAILAGSFSFMGTAQAATLLSEDFEGGANAFVAPTYNYSALYTMPNLLVPAGGLKYLCGGPIAPLLTKTYSAGSLSLLVGGTTAAQIDGGLVSYNLYAQFSTYRLQGDYATLSVQFLDGSSSPLGSALQLGGSAFASALGMGISGYGTPPFTDMRDWGADTLGGLVPLGARFAQVDVIESKVPSGNAVDGYVDNINISLNVIPEPGTAGVFALGGGLLALMRRRRR